MSTLRADPRPACHARGSHLRAEPPLRGVAGSRYGHALAGPLEPVQSAGPASRPLDGISAAAAAMARASDTLRAHPSAEAPQPAVPRPEPAPDAMFLHRMAGERPAPAPQPRTVPPRRDPAPSRLSYKMERLWLTPLFRRFMRYGLPVFVVAALAGGYLASEARRDRIAATFTSLRQQIENRPEFMVRYMAINGASAPVDSAIRQLATVPLPASSFQLDLEGMRAAIEEIDAVDSVRLQVKPGGVLDVTVTERRPAVLWRTAQGLEMLDATGHRVATLLDRSKRADLPVIAGEGASLNVPEALAILAAAQPVLPRVRGLVRVGERRWDMVLDRGQVIRLPETGAVEAVERTMAIDAAEEMLARDVAVVDLRNPERPTLQLGAGALAAMTTMTEELTKVAGQ